MNYEINFKNIDRFLNSGGYSTSEKLLNIFYELQSIREKAENDYSNNLLELINKLMELEEKVDNKDIKELFSVYRISVQFIIQQEEKEWDEILKM